MKKITLPSEIMYLAANAILSLSVAMIAATNFGVSMIVAPAYILHLKLGVVTFGQCEYIVQGMLFILFCILMKKIKPIYFAAFGCSIIYGAMLDLWRLIPILNANITEPGSLPMVTKIIFFAVGEILTAISVAMFFRCYIYPQICDFFVMGISKKFNLKQSKFKIFYDASSLALALILSFVLFGKLVGIGVGTVIATCVNGVLIALFGKLLDKYFEFKPIFKKFSTYFEL